MKKEFIISQPNKKSRILIIYLLIGIILLFSFILVLFTELHSISVLLFLVILTFQIIILYLFLRELFWQFMGIRELKIIEKKLVFTKKSFLPYKSKIIECDQIKSIKIKVRKNLDTPIFLLWLGIVDRIVITVCTEYKKIYTLSGMSMKKAIKLKNDIEKTIKYKNYAQ